MEQHQQPQHEEVDEEKDDDEKEAEIPYPAGGCGWALSRAAWP